MSAVVIVDYGVGNLHSVVKALGRYGETTVSRDPDQIRRAPRLVLPGVGAFGDGMRELTERGLVAPLREFVQTGRPFLGICLGMQLLLTQSTEFGNHPGLDIVPGTVELIRPSEPTFKVPQVGWNAIRPAGAGWGGTVLGATREGESFYFVHSYTAVPAREEDRLADSDYGGVRISSAVRRENVTGLQFHPEKSGPAGLAIVAEFLRH